VIDCRPISAPNSTAEGEEIMSDHAWAQEHIATAVADGLSAQEADRFNAHVRDCPECAAALHDARTLNDRLGSLFAPARPDPMLEDRVIRGLREATTRRRRLSGWRRRLAIGLAASVGIGVAGVAAEWLLVSGTLPTFDRVSLRLPYITSEDPVAPSTIAAAGLSEKDRNADSMANDLGGRLNSAWANNSPSANSIRGGEAKSPVPAQQQVARIIPYDQRGKVFNEIPQDFYNSNAQVPVWAYGTNTSGTNAQTAPPNASSTNFPIYKYDGPVGLNSQVRLGDKQNGALKWEDLVPPSSALSLSQGIPDVQTLGLANNGRVFLGVDKPAADGGPAIGLNGTANGVYPNLLQRERGAATGSLMFGEGVNSNAGVNGSVTLGNSQRNAGGDLGGLGLNSANSTPAQTNATNTAQEKANAANTSNSLGYINPSDMKPAVPVAEQQRAGGISAGEAKGGKSGGEQLARQAPTRQVEAYPAQQITFPAPADAAPAAEPAAPRKVVIRSGEMEFEVESFDSAVATVTKLVTGTPGAYVATVNSDKLPNGRVKGAIALRVPPEHLDSLVLDLRKELGKGGELKGQKIGSQDISKQYTDLESRLRAARTMEARLLQMIKEGKGEIKQLLEAEKELGTWRTKIEECEGELRYFGNLVALSTLTIALEEKGIRAAAAITECERVQTGIEVEDVDKALQKALADVAEANGRVTKSELKQLAAGQFNATLHCELSPTAAGPFRDRLSQQGHVARLEIDRVQTNEGGTVARNAKVTRGDTQFLIQFYNLANVAPRETRTVLIAVADVPAGYQSLREAIAKTRGRVLTSRLDEQDRQNVTAQLDFEVPRGDEGALSSALATAGEVVARNAARATDGENLTDAKVLFRTALVSAGRLRPREITTLAVEVPDVDAAIAVLKAQVGEASGRSVDAQAARERSGRVTARLIYDVPLSAASALVEKVKAAGIVRVQQAAQDQQAPDGKLATARLDVTLSNTDLIVAKDDGLWPQVRRGLSLSALVLLTSVTWVVFGLCVVLPWAMVGYGGYRLFRWLVPKGAAAPAAPATAT
jgi:hypothetical protein